MHMKIKQDILVDTKDSVVVGYATVNRKVEKKENRILEQAFGLK